MYAFLCVELANVHAGFMTHTNFVLVFYKFYNLILKIGDTWNDGLCRQCLCEERSGSAETSCHEQSCPVCPVVSMILCSVSAYM